MNRAIAAGAFATLMLVTTAPANAVTWEYSNNGKGNHYLQALANPFSLTFACNGTKVIGFYSVPLSMLDEQYKRVKVIYSVARVDGDLRGYGSYTWFSGPGSAGKTEDDLNIDMNPGGQVVKMLHDLSTAQRELAVGITLENPAKGHFATKYAAVFSVDGAADAVSQLFEACKIR